MANANGAGTKRNSDSSKANNAYETKFQDMQKYIPFLERMIQRFKRDKGGPREAQLAKMKSLYTILNDGKHKLTLESLEKCESILRNLYQKVEGEGEMDINQPSLSPKNSDGKLKLPPTTPTKAKENEPNPNRVFGSSKKPASGFKKNFKKQRLANVKAPCHAGLPQSIASQAKPSGKPSECPLKVPKRATKVASKISDLKSGKIKKNILKHGNKVSIPSFNTKSSNEELKNNDHDKSTINQSQIQPSTINADQDRLVVNSPLTQHSTSNLDKKKVVISSPVTQHSTSSLEKKNVVVSSPVTQHSTSSLGKKKVVISSPVTQHSTSGLEKKKVVVSSSVEQHSTTNSHENKKLQINSPVVQNSTLNSDHDKRISDSSVTQHSALNSDKDKQIVDSQVTQNSTIHSNQDEQIVSCATLQHPCISSDDYPSISKSVAAVCDRPQSSSPSQFNNNRAESVGSSNNSLQQKLSSNSTFKTCDDIIKPTTLTNASDSPPLKSDELSKNNSTLSVLSENKFEKIMHTSDDNVTNSLITRCDQQKRPVLLPSPKDPRLSRSLLAKSVVNERWKQPANLLQENVASKTEPSQSQSLRAKLAEEITAVHKVGTSVGGSLRAKLAEEITTVHKVGTSVGGSLRAKLAEEITTVHKVGTSVGGALRSLTKNMSSIEQNRIANLKPGTIIDLMDKELPKTNKKSLKQELLSNQIPDHQNVKSNQSSNNVHKPALSALSKEELEKLVVQNIHNLPTLPPGTKQILERISSNSSRNNPINYHGNNSANSDQASNRFDSCQQTTSEFHNRAEGSLSNSANSDQASNRFDSFHKSRSSEFYNRVEGSLSKPANSVLASDRFDSCQDSRTSSNEFYSREEGSSSKSINSDQAANRFDSSQNSRTSDFYNRVESPAGNYSRWENHAFDSANMSSPFRIQSPNYTQTNSLHDTSCANNSYYNRNIGRSSSYDPPISSQSPNDNLPPYGMKYYNRDPRRRSQEQAECIPEAEDWQRVIIIPEDRSQYTPDYPGSDSVWSEDNSRLSSRYHKGNMVPDSPSSPPLYGRSHMTSRSNPIPSSGRRPEDHRFNTELESRRRFSNSRSSLDYPEDRRHSDTRSASERRVSDARVKRYRDYNDSFPERSAFDLEQHERVNATSFRSSHDRPFNSSSADRYNTFSDRSGLSQERVYSDRMAPNKRFTDSYRSNTRRETFSSPLDQLYSETRGPVTGRGYGVQNFRIPRFKSKESDHPSKRKPFEKNTSKDIENEDDLKSIEQKAQSDDSLSEKSSSKEISHPREELTLSEERKIDNDTTPKKSLVCDQNVTDEIPISVSNSAEEQKIILLKKSDIENTKEEEKKIIFPDHDPLDSKKLEVGGKFEITVPDNDKLLERSDDSSEHNRNSESMEKQTANKRSDSMLSTTPEIPGDELGDTRSSFKVSSNETSPIETKASENQNHISQENTVCNIISETTQKSTSALTETINIPSSSTEMNESSNNERSVEISNAEKKSEIQNLKDMSDNGKYISQTAKTNSDDQLSQNQASKEIEQPKIDSTCLENINSNQNLNGNFPKLKLNNLKKSNDRSIEVGFTDESEKTVIEESFNENENCKIEELCNTEDKEPSNSGCGQLNKTNSDNEEHKKSIKKSMILDNLSRERVNPKKLKKIQQILVELSSDEEDNTDNKNIGSEYQEDIKPIIILGTGLENDETAAINNNEPSSNKNDDASSNENLKELNSTTNQITNLTEQCTANIKNSRTSYTKYHSKRLKTRRNLRNRSKKSIAIPENVETSQELEKGKKKKSELDKLHDVEPLQELEKGKKKKSELDKLHDGLREMSLKVEIEKSTGIRSCRLRNLNITAPNNKVDKSPDANNSKKLQKEKASTKDEIDTCVNDSGIDLNNKEKTKDSLEHEHRTVGLKNNSFSNSESHFTISESDKAFDNKLEGSAEIESKKSSIEIDKQSEDDEQNTTESTSNLDVENKEDSDDPSKGLKIPKDSDKIKANSTIDPKDHQQKNKLRAEDDLIKSLLMSGSNAHLTSSLKSTAIVLMQKSNALMKNNKTFPSDNDSESNLAAKSLANESKCHDQDEVKQKLLSTAVCTVICEKVADNQVSDEAVVETKDLSAPKKPKKTTKKKDLQQATDKDQSVNIVKFDKNPVILLEKSNCDLVESVCETATEMQISSNSDDVATDSAIQSETSEEPDMEGVCRKRLQPEYTELPNIFTDKTYFQKDSAACKLQKPFDCKICNFFGKSIVRHYVTEHSDQDVLISRLEAKDAEEAIMKSKNEEINIKPSLFKCYMCCRTCTLLLSFYDHITAHTGEYRYRCQLCQYKFANRDAIKSHISSSHSLDWKMNFKTAVAVDTISDLKNVFGYICSECYFVQLKQSTVVEHVKNHHSDSSDAKVIRINMSSLDTHAVLNTDRKDSLENNESLLKIHDNLIDDNINRNVQENIPENCDLVDGINGNAQENVPENDLNVQENSESIVNVSAFSCIELINDVNEKRSIMKTALQNIEETLFNKEQIVCETISGKIGKLSNSWKSSSGNEPILSRSENISQCEPEFPPEKVVESNELVNLSCAEEDRAAVQDIIEQVNFEEDQVVHQDDETIFSEEIRLETFNLEATDNNSVELEESTDDSHTSLKINCLLNRCQSKSEDSEEQNSNANCDYDSDGFENEELRNKEIDFSDLISKANCGSEVLSQVDVGPLTIRRSKESMTFSCNINSCGFTSDNPKYIVCHFGNHLDSNSTLNCSCCDEEFDTTLDTVGLMKGLVKHGLEHVLPPSPDKDPEDTGKGDLEPESVEMEQPRRGLIRVRRLSGDQLSSFSSEDVIDRAEDSSSQQQTSNSNDSVGNLRIESVFSAANCDLETFKTLASLHYDKNGPKRRRLDRPAQLFEEASNFLESGSINIVFLTDFFKCMGEGCGFSTNDVLMYKDHLKRLHCRKKKDGFWNKCPYCTNQEPGMVALFNHLVNYHSRSKYQCAYCLYRAYARSNVVFHQNSVHVNQEIKIYVCKLPVPATPPKYIPKKKNVIPVFECPYERCGVKSLIWEAISAHVVQHKFSQWMCHICHKDFGINHPIELLQHYSSNHNIGRYQCLYCLHSANTTEEMREHLCKCHCDLPAEAVLRMFKETTKLELMLFFATADFEKLTIENFDDLIHPEGSLIQYPEQNVDDQLWQVQRSQQRSEEPSSQWTMQPFNEYSCISRPVASTSQLRMQPPNMSTEQQSNMAISSIPLDNDEMICRFAMEHRSPACPSQLFGENMANEQFLRISIPSSTPVASTSQLTSMDVIEISSDSESANQSEVENNQVTESKTSNSVCETSLDSEGDTTRDGESYMCFLCNKIDGSPDKMVEHIVDVHRVTRTKIIAMNHCDPENTVTKVVRSDIVICNTPTKSSLDLKTKYAMHEIELLPNKAILSSPIYCDHCGFSNVVVKNMKIHLQNHASGKEVSNTLLVNPVPCLEKNEKMFDKMVNLAGSSHLQPSKAIELSNFVAPKFVDQTERFVCSVCRYVTLQDTMLINHLKGIHEDTPFYACPHCTDVQVAIDKIGHHLKMHDNRMYRCAYCTYHHYQRHLIGKHLHEKHPEKKPFVQIVRDPTDDGSKSVDEDEFNSCTKSIKVWQCSFCDTYRNREHLIKQHCEEVHGISHRYKCCFCDSTSESEGLIHTHFKSEHPGNDLQVVNVYDRVCIFAPLPDYNSSFDVGLPRRREKNLRDNIRGITFAENLRAPSRRSDNSSQHLSQFKCPTCDTFLCKTKDEMIHHMWSEYEKSRAPSSSNMIETKRKEIVDWINAVVEQQEQRIMEHQTILTESGETSERETSSNDDRPRPYYRKRSVSNRNTTDSSDDAADQRKTKRVKNAKPRYKCGYCNYKSLMVKSMSNHQRTRHPGLIEVIHSVPERPQQESATETEDQRVFECQVCGRQDKKKPLLDHFANTHRSSEVKIALFEGEVFKCNHCGNVDVSYERVVSHSENEHSNMPVNISTELQTTTEQPTSPQQLIESFFCPICKNKRPSQDLMFACVQSHMFYSCSFCNADFNARSACALHVLKEHAALLKNSEEHKEHVSIAFSHTVISHSENPVPGTSSAGISRSPAPSTSSAGISRSPAPSTSSAGISRSPAPSTSSAGISRSPAPSTSSAGISRSPAPSTSSAGNTANFNCVKSVGKKSTVAVKKAVAKKSTAKTRVTENDELSNIQPTVVLSDVCNPSGE